MKYDKAFVDGVLDEVRKMLSDLPMEPRVDQVTHTQTAYLDARTVSIQVGEYDSFTIHLYKKPRPARPPGETL